MQTLQNDSVLQGGKYKIKKVLGQGGFGITYLAENTLLDGKVAIKEFFFKEYCDRDETTSHVTIGTSGNRDIVERFKQKFIKEARTIFRLDHPNIVRILDIFEENATAYYVMEYVEGVNLNDLVKQRGAIPENEAKEYVKAIGDALEYMHGRRMNHLDVKPSNIMKRESDGRVFLIDFGVSKQYDSVTSEGTTTTPVGVSKGYSPNEQYVIGGVQSFSPQSDVYSLAATMFKLLTGITPPEAALVIDEGIPVCELEKRHVSLSVIEAIKNAMQTKSKRTQSIKAFLNSIESDTIVEDSDNTIFINARENYKSDESDAISSNLEEELEDDSTRYKWIAIVVGGLILIAIVFGYSMMGDDSEKIKEEQQIEGKVNTVENATIVLTKGHESKRNFVYTGEVDADGLPHGKGTGQYPETKSSGSCTFTGIYEHGLTSEGEMVFKSGAKYKGTFTDGYFNKGTWWDQDGFYFNGSFRDGKPYNGIWYTPEGREDGKIVNGK